MVLFEDETDLLLFPPLRAAWARRGEPAPVPITGVNQKRVIWGVLNVLTGYRLLWDSPQQRAADFVEFLDWICWRLRGRHLAVILDGDSSHSAQATQDEAEYLGVELLELPKRNPHLNPVDHLWRHAKQVVCANRQYDSLEEQVHAFMAYVYGLSPRQALRKAGVLSPNFWLSH